MDWDKFVEALDESDRTMLREALNYYANLRKFDLDSTEMALAIKGDKLEAIKHIRNRLNLGLIEGKALVEQFLSKR